MKRLFLPLSIIILISACTNNITVKQSPSITTTSSIETSLNPIEPKNKILESSIPSEINVPPSEKPIDVRPSPSPSNVKNDLGLDNKDIPIYPKNVLVPGTITVIFKNSSEMYISSGLKLTMNNATEANIINDLFKKYSLKKAISLQTQDLPADEKRKLEAQYNTEFPNKNMSQAFIFDENSDTNEIAKKFRELSSVRTAYPETYAIAEQIFVVIISGIVKDTNGIPIENVSLTFTRSDVNEDTKEYIRDVTVDYASSGTDNNKGFYIFRNIFSSAPREYSAKGIITVEKDGYKTITKEINISKNPTSDYKLDFVLEKQ